MSKAILRIATGFGFKQQLKSKAILCIATGFSPWIDVFKNHNPALAKFL